MSVFDEESGPARKGVALDETELSRLSVAEIDQRIALLRAEIERLEAERRRKGDSRASAEALFR